MADSTARGRFVWHELMTPNGAGAHEFYKKTVGWNTQAWEHDKSYVMFVGPNGPLGASIESRDGAPQWIPYVGTDEVDATVQEATRRGGGVTKPTASIADGGTYAVLTDPHGATFGVHRGPASQQPPPVAPPKHGEFSWHELATTAQPGAAFEFYSALFGWEKLSEFDMGPMGIYLIFGRDGTQLGGMFNKGDMGKPGPAYWVSYVRVKNVHDTIGQVKSARGALLNGPMDVPGGDQIAQFTDPHGAFFAGHTLAVDVKAGAAAAPAKAAGAAAPPKAAGRRGSAESGSRRGSAESGSRRGSAESGSCSGSAESGSCRGSAESGSRSGSAKSGSRKGSAKSGSQESQEGAIQEKEGEEKSRKEKDRKEESSQKEEGQEKSCQEQTLRRQEIQVGKDRQAQDGQTPVVSDDHRQHAYARSGAPAR